MRAFIGIIGLYLVIALALPLGLMLGKSVQGPKDEFVGHEAERQQIGRAHV